MDVAHRSLYPGIVYNTTLCTVSYNRKLKSFACRNKTFSLFNIPNPRASYFVQSIIWRILRRGISCAKNRINDILLQDISSRAYHKRYCVARYFVFRYEGIERFRWAVLQKKYLRIRTYRFQQNNYIYMIVNVMV